MAHVDPPPITLPTLDAASQQFVARMDGSVFQLCGTASCHITKGGMMANDGD